MNPGDGGFIVVHRKLLEHALVRKLPAAWFRTFMVILMKANWKPGIWWDGHQEITIQPGQMITSVQRLAEISRASTKQVRGCLGYLQAANIAAIETAKLYTKITLLKWDVYQLIENDEGKQRGNADGELGAKSGQSEGKEAATIEQSNKGIIIIREQKHSDQGATGDHEHGPANGKAENPFPQIVDDDEKPQTYANPEDELKAICLKKQLPGDPITAAVLMGIRETLELKGVSLSAYVAEIRKHVQGHWKNPAGFLRSKANKFKSETRPATAAPAVRDVVVQAEDKCPTCGSRRGQGLLFVNREAVPCRCATPEYIAAMQAKGVVSDRAVAAAILMKSIQ